MMVKLVGVLDCLDDQEHAAERNGQRKKPGEHPAPTHLRRVHRQGHRQTAADRSEEHTSELQSRLHLVCRLLLEKKKNPSDDVSIESYVNGAFLASHTSASRTLSRRRPPCCIPPFVPYETTRCTPSCNPSSLRRR